MILGLLRNMDLIFALNYVSCWGPISEDLGNVESSLLCYYSSVNLNLVWQCLLGAPSIGQIDLFTKFSYSIGILDTIQLYKQMMIDKLKSAL